MEASRGSARGADTCDRRGAGDTVCDAITGLPDGGGATIGLPGGETSRGKGTETWKDTER